MTAFLEAEEPKKYREDSTEEITKMTKYVHLYWVFSNVAREDATDPVIETHTSR